MDEDVFSDPFDENYVHSTQVALSRPRLDSRMSVCVPTKGLLSAPGENNCFLNVSVQVRSIFFHSNSSHKSVNCEAVRKCKAKIISRVVLFKLMPGCWHAHRSMRSYVKKNLFSYFGLSFFEEEKSPWKHQIKITSAKKW